MLSNKAKNTESCNQLNQSLQIWNEELGEQLELFLFFSYIKKTKPSDTLVQRERCVTSPLRDRERAKSLSSKIFYFSF